MLKVRNMENPKINQLKLTVRPKDAGVVYVTFTVDQTPIIEDQLAKMEEFKEANDILSKFKLHGKD